MYSLGLLNEAKGEVPSTLNFLQWPDEGDFWFKNKCDQLFSICDQAFSW